MSSAQPSPPPCTLTPSPPSTATMAVPSGEAPTNAEGEGTRETPESRESEEEEEDDEEEEDEEEDDEDEDESGESERVPRKCVYEGCTETTTQVAKPRKPWMCKKHRNKTYKDKYKRKKNVQALAGTNKSDDDTDERPVSVTKQRLSCMIVHQASRKASLLEQVLNQKRLSLLRSPEVIQFLQEQQRLLSSQAHSQRQQSQDAPM
ncbi:regulatory factor X-associated protein [Rhinoraja longicauda]